MNDVGARAMRATSQRATTETLKVFCLLVSGITGRPGRLASYGGSWPHSIYVSTSPGPSLGGVKSHASQFPAEAPSPNWPS